MEINSTHLVPGTDPKYNQELWDAACGSDICFDVMTDSEQPSGYKKKDCFNLQCYLYQTYGIVATSKEVYEVWCFYSRNLSAGWMEMYDKDIERIFKKFMDGEPLI